jgi:hypothetical protein
VNKLLGKVNVKKQEIGLVLGLLAAGISGANAQGFPMDSLDSYKLQEDSSIIPDTNYFTNEFFGWDLGNAETFEKSDKVDNEEVYKDTTKILGYAGNHKGRIIIYKAEKKSFDHLGNLVKEEVFEKDDFDAKSWEGFNSYSVKTFVYDSNRTLIDESFSQFEIKNLKDDIKDLVNDKIELVKTLESSTRISYKVDEKGNILEELTGSDFNGDGILDEVSVSEYIYDEKDVLLTKLVSKDLNADGEIDTAYVNFYK